MEKSQVHFARNRPKSNTLTLTAWTDWLVSPRLGQSRLTSGCNNKKQQSCAPGQSPGAHGSSSVAITGPLQWLAKLIGCNITFGGGASGVSETPLTSFRSICSPRLQNNITAYLHYRILHSCEITPKTGDDTCVNSEIKRDIEHKSYSEVNWNET